jgi:hypothetical protein
MIIVSVIYLSSCNSGDSFYNDYSREDLYRLPLLKPYELLNIYGADPTDLDFHSWSLKLLSGDRSQLNVSNIQVSKGVIYGHGKDGLTLPPNYWFVIIPEQKIEMIFKKKDEWVAFLKQKQINPESVYKIWPIFEQYKKDATLPWHKE